MSCPHLFPVSLLCFCGGFEGFEVQPSWGPGNIRKLTPGLSWGLRGAGLWVPVLVSLRCFRRWLGGGDGGEEGGVPISQCNHSPFSLPYSV